MDDLQSNVDDFLGVHDVFEAVPRRGGSGKR